MHHLTLMTGHTCLSPRTAVDDRTIDLIRPAVIAGRGTLGNTGWQIKMVSGSQPGGAAFECHSRGLWVVSCYMAWEPAGADEMWAAAMTHLLVLPGIRRPPTLPWLAAAIMPGVLRLDAADLLFEVADLERCVAWTVLEHAAQWKAAA